MSSELQVVLLALAIFAGMLLCLDLGYRTGKSSLRRHGTGALEGMGSIETAVFGVLGLLLAFSFSGATSRLDSRRQLIVTEANAISTAYQRIDVLPGGEQPEMRRLFREYLDTRLRAYAVPFNPTIAERELAQAATLQQAIWSRSIIATAADPTGRSALLFLPAVNAIGDVATARTIALHTHLPDLVFALLIAVALLSGLTAGHALARRPGRSWFHNFLYASVVAATIYVVLDLENPRSGLIRLEAADSALSGLRDSIR
jgi:hypothetical protein